MDAIWDVHRSTCARTPCQEHTRSRSGVVGDSTPGSCAEGALAAALSGGGYNLTWNSIDGGGKINATGDAYALSGPIGQADAGMKSGGSYTFNGGYWVDFFGNWIQLPLITR